jgi:hypothetical protein
MVLIDLQSSKVINEHLTELIESYDRSKQKKKLKGFINFWRAEYKRKLIEEYKKIDKQ